MRYLRAKHIRKALRQYKFLCQIRNPYKILLDGNFIAMCIKMNVDLFERLPKFLQTDHQTTLQYYVHASVLAELEALGESMTDAIKLAKQCHILKDSQAKASEPNVQASILNLVGERNGAKYFVATQDIELRQQLRRISGVPLMYLNRSVLVFEELSRTTLAISRQQDQAKMSHLSGAEHQALKSIREAEDENSDRRRERPSGPVYRTKRAKGPNPLSMKKKNTTSRSSRRSVKKV